MLGVSDSAKGFVGVVGAVQSYRTVWMALEVEIDTSEIEIAVILEIIA